MLPLQCSSWIVSSTPLSKYLTSVVLAPSLFALTGRSSGNKGLKSFLRFTWWNRVSRSPSSFQESTPFAMPLGSVNLPPLINPSNLSLQLDVWIPFPFSQAEQPGLKPYCISLEKVMASCLEWTFGSSKGSSAKMSSNSGSTSSRLTSSSNALTSSSKRSTGKSSKDSSFFCTASRKGNLSSPVCTTTIVVRT